jgi:isopenicillin N synthase-like dioxygenase
MASHVQAIPVIDISSFFGASVPEKKRLAKQIDAACKATGFLIISGHCVPDALVERMQRVSRAFFDMPSADKRRFASGDAKVYRGYFELGGLAAAYSREERSAGFDYREMYMASRDVVDHSDPYYNTDLARRIFVPNIWPDPIAEFHATWVEYYHAMEKLGDSLLHLFALALDLPEAYFEPFFTKHMSTMAVQDYPDQPNEPKPGQLRCGAHTDYGAFTILKAEDKPGGLEVETSSGIWEPVPIVPSAFIVNIGDLFARWTNDLWASSMHRVNNPPRDRASGSRRLSVVYFFHPNYDSIVECLPTCKAEVAKYPPISTFEHISSKIAKMQVQTKA